jgi:hypothetical protein
MGIPYELDPNLSEWSRLQIRLNQVSKAPLRVVPDQANLDYSVRSNCVRAAVSESFAQRLLSRSDELRLFAARFN